MLTWLAYSDEELRRAHDLAATLSEQETRDELGIGSIRDAIADRLFPGTSTIQSRARYFLFLPWLFQDIETRSTVGARQRSDRAERDLIASLRQSDDTVGLVGGRTSRVERLPSVIYWNGLGILGIRRIAGSLSSYFRWLDDPGRHTRVVRDDDGVALLGTVQTWWDRVPEPPDDFPQVATFALNHRESRYLADQARSVTPRETLLSFLFDRGSTHSGITVPWEHPQRSSMPASIQDDLVVAEAFSAIHRGAALLFNLLIAEAREEESRQDDYRTQLEHWQTSAAQTLESFDLARVWAMAPASSRRAREFIVAWRAAARRSAGGSVAESGAARELVADRELRVKGTRRSRIANPQRVPWNGASGSAQLDFRWGASVQRLTLDVAEGRDRA